MQVESDYSSAPSEIHDSFPCGDLIMWRSLLLAVVLISGCLQHDTNPTPDPQPVPQPVEPIEPGLTKVLILYESDDFKTLPPSQVNAIQSAKLRKWLDVHQADYRIWDKDTDATHADPFWQKSLKLPHGALPWMWISANGKSRDGAMPKTIDDTLKTLDAALSGKP